MPQLMVPNRPPGKDRWRSPRHSHERLGLSWPRIQIATELGSGDNHLRTHQSVVLGRVAFLRCDRKLWVAPNRSLSSRGSLPFGQADTNILTISIEVQASSQDWSLII